MQGSPRPAPARLDIRGHHDGPWDNTRTPWGKFVLDETGPNPSIGCHCLEHGCRINKVAYMRLVGWMAAWIEAGRADTSIAHGPNGRQAHMALRFLTAPGQALDQGERLRARLSALADPAMARVFAWEREASDIAPEIEPETVHVRGHAAP